MSKDELIEIEGQHYVLATSSRLSDPPRVLKHGDSFAVFDRSGDAHVIGLGEQGIFFEGTRYLSKMELTIEGMRPVLLNSTIKNNNTLLTVDLTNPTLYRDGVRVLPQGSIHIFRAKLLWEGVCYEHLRLINYTDSDRQVTLSMALDADYADIFEVRGKTRAKRGKRLPIERNNKHLLLRYEGLDNITRQTRIEFSEEPSLLEENEAHFNFNLSPGGERELLLFVEFYSSKPTPRKGAYDAVLRESAETLQRARNSDCAVTTSNEQFNNWLNRSQADVHMLITTTSHGPYPYAGIPWFSTPFGRDGIITALEYLWVNPDIARGALHFLAKYQATEVNPDQEAEPGKIFHEVRKGEMAALGEIPFGCYYGTVDATPLFVMLAGEYYDCTRDLALIRSIWPNIEAALKWMDVYGDADGDGFVEYQRHNPRGLVHQGWKDSDDSVFHADGHPAEGHIALCEVQGYVFAAKRHAAKLARLLDKSNFAADLDRQADILADRFNRAFWCDDLGTFAIALDGDKQPCRVRSSNAGHVLYTGIAWPDNARRTADTLLSPESFSGWGVRTIATNAARYNPMSYHNGSIWPHDNAMIAMGLARYGFQDKALQLLTGLFDASLYVDLHRLPELFCGFVRRIDEGPTRYPAACIPQAWASASAFYLLQACLGLSFSSTSPHVRFNHPLLPDILNRVEFRNLRVGNGSVDLALHRYRQDVSVNVLRKEGDIDIAIIL